MYNIKNSIKSSTMCHPYPYEDEQGYLVLGYAHKIKHGISPEDSERQLDSDIQSSRYLLTARYEWLIKIVPTEKLDALVELTFWYGVREVSKLRDMLLEVRQQHWTEAATLLMDSEFAKDNRNRLQHIANVIAYNAK